MEYRFFDRSDEALIATSDLPVEGGIALALRTTGYDADNDEVVQLAIVDFDGNELFSHKVKPQNVEEWDDSAAAGGLTPADVADEPELYQFEEEISALFEAASIVVAQHVDFATAAIEASWVTLPDFQGFDLVGQFRESHSTADYAGQAAAAATLEGIAAYYGQPATGSTLADEARCIAACYRKLVEEHAAERLAKGAAYWEEYDRKLEEKRQGDERYQRAVKNHERRLSRANAFLWFASFILFGGLASQLFSRGADIGLVVICAAIAVFALVRGIINVRK